MKTGELDLPDGINNEGDPTEFVRFWVCDNEDLVSLRVGCFHPDHEPELWGSIIADIAKHAARALTQERPDVGTVDHILARIRAGFDERLAELPDISGQLRGTRN